MRQNSRSSVPLRAQTSGSKHAVFVIGLALSGTVIARGQCNPGWTGAFGPSGANSGVEALAVLPGGDVVAGGSFTTIGGQATGNRVARYSISSGTWSSLGTGTNGNIVYALATLPDGDVLAGGNFSSLGGVTINRIGRFDFDTQLWSDLGYGTQGGVVEAIQVLPTGDLIVGGNIPRVAGITVNHIARYSATTGLWSTMNSNFVSTGDRVSGLALAPDGSVIVGGIFTAGGKNRIGRYHPDTNTWSSLGAGLNGTVRAVAVLPGGDVIAAGDFTTAGGVPASRVARFNPTTSTWSALGTTGVSGGFNYVNALTVLPNGDLIAGGSFTVAGGVAAARVARYDPVTDTWAAFVSGTNNDVNALATLQDGDVVAGGVFTSPGGRIARYTFGGTTPAVTSNPSSLSRCSSGEASFQVQGSGTSPLNFQWQWTLPGSQPDWTVMVEGVNTDTAGTPVFVATGSSTGNVTLSPPSGGVYPVIRWDVPLSVRCSLANSCGSDTSDPASLTVCPADLTCDGGVDIGDLLFFLGAFEAGSTDADLDDGTGTGTPNGGVDVSDLLYFLSRFEAGC